MKTAKTLNHILTLRFLQLRPRVACPTCGRRAHVEQLRISHDGGKTFINCILYRCLRTSGATRCTNTIQEVVA